jgi:RNA polymerase sigma-70 factor (ECF subfamily)
VPRQTDGNRVAKCDQSAGDIGVDPIAAHNDALNEGEFVQLLTSFQSNLYLYIRSLTLNPDDIAEILQETNLVLWEKKEQFKRQTNFLAWAFQIARYKLLEQLQRKQKSVCFSDAFIDELAVQASHCVETSELLDELHRCLTRLPPADYALVSQRYSTQATCEKIADAIGRPVRWVYKALARIREELLDCIAHSSDTRRDQ